MGPLLRSLLAFVLVAVASVRAEPARYVVLEIDALDNVTLLSEHQVEVPASLLDQAPVDRRSSEPVEVVARDADGAIVHRASMHVERTIRAEFPASDGTLQSHRIAGERVPFVVLVPATASRLDVRAGAQSQVRQLALPKGTATAQSNARVRGEAEDSAHRLDLLIVGDGYTAAQVDTFDRDAARLADGFFGIAPYAGYRRFVNLRTLFVPSAQSGADHPVCAEGSDDPKEGTFVDTAFDATFCSSGLQRLLTVNGGKVYAAAASVPNWDVIIVLVNDSMYGGAGGSISVASNNDSAVPLVQHEFAHSFTGLADEYSTPYPGYPLCTDLGGFEGCEANVTDQTVRGLVKWRAWIDEATPVPTPSSFPGVGLFLGARYRSAGAYRPKGECMMNGLGSPFCEVCAEAYVLRLYRGWRGSEKLRLIENAVPSAQEITTQPNANVSFSVDVAELDRGGPQIGWFVDGQSAGSDAIFGKAFAPGTYRVEVRVTDTTSLVHPTRAAPLTQTRSWTVHVKGAKRRSVR
jgi:hypothetical protein